jgi:hypothetical protein
MVKYIPSHASKTSSSVAWWSCFPDHGHDYAGNFEGTLLEEHLCWIDPIWCYAMRYNRHKLMVHSTEKLTFAWFLRPWEYRVSSCLLHELWGLLNVIHNWMAITVAYGFMGKYDKGLDSSRLGFTPLTMERYSLGPLGVTVSTIV